MSNYDNASDEVKSAYSDGKWWGVWEERERIIALLVHESPFGRKHRNDFCVTCDNIALIKGENE